MATTGKIAVVGGTGRVGRHVVDVLRARGADVVPMARSLGIDVVTGAGLAEALDGVRCVVDAASGPSPEQQAATAFFTAASANLQRAGADAGVQRIIVVSIIGTDRFTGGYGAAKLAHEQALLAGPIPARVVRAAQFHEFVRQLMDWGTQGDVCYLPDMRTQLVAARAVAEILADVALDPSPAAATAPTLEVAGPKEERLVDAATLLASRQGGPLKIEAVRNPGDPDGALYENGALLPGPGAVLTGPTFEAWLDGAA